MNKMDFLHVLGLKDINEASDKKIMQISKKNTPKNLITTKLDTKRKKNKRNFKYNSKLVFSFPITVVSNNSLLSEKFYKGFTKPGEQDFKNYEKYCQTAKNDCLNKSQQRAIYPIATENSMSTCFLFFFNNSQKSFDSRFFL